MCIVQGRVEHGHENEKQEDEQEETEKGKLALFLGGNWIFIRPGRQAYSCPSLNHEDPIMELLGLGNLEVINVLKNLVNKHNPSCVFLCETKGNRSRV